MKEHSKLYQKQVSKVTLHFVYGHLSRNQTMKKNSTISFTAFSTFLSQSFKKIAWMNNLSVKSGVPMESAVWWHIFHELTVKLRTCIKFQSLLGHHYLLIVVCEPIASRWEMKKGVNGFPPTQLNILRIPLSSGSCPLGLMTHPLKLSKAQYHLKKDEYLWQKMNGSICRIYAWFS